jgi:NTE family protein
MTVNEKKKKSIALVFSGGAIRGFSQVGAYLAINEFIKKNDYEIKALAGTSFGSIISGFIAAGFDASKVHDISAEKWKRLSNILDFNIFGNGLIKGDKFQRELEKHIRHMVISEVKPDIFINAVDMLSGKEFVFSKKGLNSTDGSVSFPGDYRLSTAIRASCSVPVVFAPVCVNGLVLLDGGLNCPLPLHFLKLSDYDLVLAVDVCMANFDFITPNNVTKSGIIEQSVSIIQRKYHFDDVSCALKNNPNLHVIKPKVGVVNPRKKSEFSRAINCGYDETKEYLDKILK